MPGRAGEEPSGLGSSLQRVARTYAGTWYRMLLPLGAVFLAYVVSLVVLAVVMRPLIVSQADDIRAGSGDPTLLAIIALIPVVLLLGVAGVIWGGATTYVADGSDAGRATSPWRSVWLAARRTPAGFGAIVVWAASVALAVLLFPVFVVAGLLGLVLMPLARRSRLANRWPSWPVLAVTAVPFGFAFLVATRWSLAFPAVFLDGVGVRQACANSWRAVRGRTGTVAGVLVLAVLAIFGLTFIVRAIVAPLMGGDARVIVAQLAAQVVVAPLLVVAVAVLYRMRGPDRPVRPALAPVPGSHRIGLGIVVVVALLAQFATIVVPHATAYAAPVTETAPTDAAPPADAAVPAAQAGVGAAACADPPVAPPSPAAVTFGHTGNLDGPLLPGVPTEFAISIRYEDPPCEWIQPSGNVDLFIDDVPLAPFTPPPPPLPPGQTDPGSVAYLTSFTAGTHTIKVVYGGDATYPAAQNTFPVVVGTPSTTTAVTVAPSPIVFGQPVTYEASVTGGGPTPTGVVTVYGANDPNPPTFSIDVPLVGGTAHLTTTAIPMGTHAVVAEYQGDATYLSSKWDPPVELVVFPANTSTSLSVSPSGRTEPGETVTASVRVTPFAPSEVTPRGSVQIAAQSRAGMVDIGFGPLVNGRATITMAPPPGTAVIFATFVPADGSWATSSASERHDVSTLAPSLALTSASNPTPFGQPLTLQATVTAGSPATGTVTFTARRVSAPATGSTAATVSHSANLDEPLPANTDVPFNVGLAGAPSGGGGGGGAPTGLVTVRIDDGAIPVVPPTRTLAPGDDPLAGLDFTAAFPPGPHKITVAYAGDGTFAAQEQVIDVVAKEVAGATHATRPATTGGSSAAPDSGPSGPDVVELGSAPLDAVGRASITTTDLQPGVYTVEARYSGNASIQPLTSPPLAQTIGRAAVTMAASTTASAPQVGDQVEVKVDVTPPGVANLDTNLFHQKVILHDGSDEVGSGLLTQTGASFSTTITFRVAGVGARTLTATYAGDDNLDRASAAVGLDIALRPSGVRMFGFLHRGGDYGDQQTFDGAVTTTGSGAPTGAVQLVSAQGVLATGTLDADGNFSMHTRALPAGRQLVWVEYAGDDQFLPSSVLDLLPGRDDRVAVEVAKARSVPEVAFSPAAPTVGENVTLTATLDRPGAGPTGTVEFFDVNVSPRRLLGSAPVVDGVATLKFAPTSARTLVLASYGGDRNFVPTENPSPYALLQSRPASAALTITGPGQLIYGSTGTLVVSARSAVTGGPATGSITFGSKQKSFPDRDVRLVDGQARLGVCGGDSSTCDAGAAALAAGANDVVARYSSGTGGAAAPTSATVDVAAAPTALALTTPPAVLQGSEATLAADVTFGTSRKVPAGNVVFSGLEPEADGGAARHDLGTADVDPDGHASVRVTVGSELVWPIEAIEARYARFDQRTFGSSSATNPITIERIATSLKLFAPTAPVGQPTKVSATLERGSGGSSSDPTGTITITADNGTTCTTRLDGKDRESTCSVTWKTAGEHSFGAAYSGDSVFEPSQSTPFGLSGSRGTPALHARLSSPVIQGAESEVTWAPPAGATGTVTVFADGRTWCERVDVGALSCTGTFGRDAARERLSPVRVRYSGDSTWNGVEEELKAQVQACVPIDVTTYEPNAGRVAVNTPSNCGDGGYLVGTEVSVTAAPVAPSEFRGWLQLDDAKQEGWSPKHDGAKDLSTSFVVGDDFSTWTLRAAFALPCLQVDELIGGEGELQRSSEPDCKLPDGKDGYSYGTTLDVVAFGNTNPKYEEPDVFFRFNPVPAGAQVFAIGAPVPLDRDDATTGAANPDTATDGTTPTTRVAANPLMRVPITSDVVVGAVFGPLCRDVTAAVDPPSDGDESEVVTPTNCQTTDGRGFTRFTKVKVKATSGDEHLVRDGWDVNGTSDPDLGKDGEAEVLVTGPDLAVTARYMHCFTLRAEAAPGEDVKRQPLGKVTADPEPNCPDGSKRYLDGTSVALEPVVVSDGATFVGWDTTAPTDADTTGTDATDATDTTHAGAPRSLDGSTHDPSAGAADTQQRVEPADTGATDTFQPADDADLGPTGTRTVVVDRDISTFATFYLASVCSQLGVNAPAGLVTFTTGSDTPSGCGPGYYFDKGKVFCARNPQSCKVGEREELRNTGSDLQLVLNPENHLQVSVSVSGNVPACFPLDCPGPVTGDINMRFTRCQSVKPNILVQRVGDDGEPIDPRVYSPDDFGMGNFPWIDGYPASDCVGGTTTPGAAGSWEPGSFVELRTSPPAVGFRFLGWGEVDNEVSGFTDADQQTSQAGADAPTRYLEKEGVVVQTTDDRPEIQADAFYGVQCGTLSLGEGISIVSPPPNCPGGDNSYVIGSFVMVNAAPQVGSRTFYGYKSGIVADTVTEGRDAVALIGGASTVVTGTYPTRGEEVKSLFAQAGKYVVGLLAVAAPILLTAVCGPCGIAIAALTLSAVLIDFIPGVNGKATAALQGTLFAPLNIAECSAQWGFANGTSSGYTPPPLGSPTVGQTLSAAGNVASKGASAAYAAYKASTFVVTPPTGVGYIPTSPGTAALRSLKLEATPDGFGSAGKVLSSATSWRAFRFAKAYGVPAAAFGYGVYANGGFDTKFDDFKTVDELRDTATFENCMAKPFQTLGA